MPVAMSADTDAMEPGAAAPTRDAPRAMSRNANSSVVSAVVAVTLWIVLAVVGAIGIAAVDVLGDAGCEKSESNYGKLSWSTIPPGPVCTWTTEVNGFDEVDGPSPVMSIWLVALTVLGAGSIWLVWRARRATDPCLTDNA